MAEQEQNLSAFRRFIEEDLDLDGLDDDPLDDLISTSLQNIGYIPAPGYRMTLKRNVWEIWSALQKGNPGTQYWASQLTSFERDTRSILQELVFKTVRRTYPDALTDQQMRSIVAYSMTLGWLVMAALLERYGDEEEDDEADADADFPPDARDIPF
jgi:hypothetical protein